MQKELETIKTGGCFSLQEMQDIIKEEGYDPSKAIEIVEVDGYKYIYEGHHRNFAAANLKKTLVPYIILAKDDNKTPFGNMTARQWVKSVRRNDLYNHEWIIDEEFSYNEVYPGIYDILKERDERESR